MDYRERMKRKAGVLLNIADQYLAGQISPDDAAGLIGNEMSNIRPGQLEALKSGLGERLTKARSQVESEKIFELFRNHLSPPYQKLAEGHPLKNYFDENCRLRSLLIKIDELEETESTAEDWIDIYESLQEYYIHFKRQEKNFYPLLVPAVLQSQIDRAQELHHAIRSAVTTNLELLITHDHVGFLFRQRDLSRLFMDYLDLEERLLYVKALSCLSSREFAELRTRDDLAGYAGIGQPQEFCPKEDPELASVREWDKKTRSESPGNADEAILNADQLLIALLEVQETGLICYDLSGNVTAVRGVTIEQTDLELGGEVKSALVSGGRKRLESIVSSEKGCWKVICTLIRDDRGKPRGFLKIKEKISESNTNDMKEGNALISVGLDAEIAELFAQYPKFKDDFFLLDDDLKSLKGTYGMELLKDSTIEMIAKSLRIDGSELMEKINRLLQSYNSKIR